MTLFPAWHRSALEADGYLVLEPEFLRGEDAYINVGPVAIVRRDGPFKIVSSEARVVQPGEIVAPKHPAGMPHPGVYVPTEPGFATRTVERCVGAYVFHDGDKSCHVSTWQRWVRKTRARIG